MRVFGVGKFIADGRKHGVFDRQCGEGQGWIAMSGQILGVGVGVGGDVEADFSETGTLWFVVGLRGWDGGGRVGVDERFGWGS